MPRIPYTYQAVKQSGILLDVECEIECTITHAVGADEPVIEIDAVYFPDKHDAFTINAATCVGDAWARLLAATIGNAAQDDEAFTANALEAHGYRFNAHPEIQRWVA